MNSLQNMIIGAQNMIICAHNMIICAQNMIILSVAENNYFNDTVFLSYTYKILFHVLLSYTGFYV